MCCRGAPHLCANPVAPCLLVRSSPHGAAKSFVPLCLPRVEAQMLRPPRCPKAPKSASRKSASWAWSPPPPMGGEVHGAPSCPPLFAATAGLSPRGVLAQQVPPPHADVPKSTRSNPGVICTKLLLGVPLHMQLGLFLARTFHLRRVGPKLKFLGICCLWEGSVSLCMCRTEELGLGEHRWTPGLWKVPFKPALFKFLG